MNRCIHRARFLFFVPTAIVLSLACPWYPVAASPVPDTDARAAAKIVREFESQLRQDMREHQYSPAYRKVTGPGGYGSPADTPHGPFQKHPKEDEYRQRVRDFFEGLDSPALKIEAIGVLDDRYGGSLADRDLAEELIGTLLSDPDASVRYRAVRAASYFNCTGMYPEACIKLLDEARGPDQLVAVINALGRSSHEPFIEHVRLHLEHDESVVRAHALQATIKLAPAESFDLVIRCLGDPNALVRRAAVQALVRENDPRAEAHIVEMLDDGSAGVRERALWTLGARGSRASADRIAACLRDPVGDVRAEAVRSLGAIQATEHADAVALLLNDPSVVVRRHAAEALGDMKDPRWIPALEALANDEDEMTRERAAASIRRLGDAPRQDADGAGVP